MKKSGLLIAGFFLFIFSIGLNAQTKSGYDFFAGEWSLIVTGAPQGDVKMVVNFKKIDNVVSSSIKDSTGKDLYKVTNTTIDKGQAVVTFTGSQGDVSLTLRKKDETNISGDIMGMFDVLGKKIAENK
jgi:hypothetical protein